MLELAGVLLLGLLSVQGVRYFLSRGIVFGAREKTENDAKRPPFQQRGTRREQEAERRRQPEQEREAEREPQRQRERPPEQSEEIVWWRVLEVSPYASADEIRRSYLQKMSESHPDRVALLAPELLPEAERRSKMLNAAYAQAILACRGSGERGGSGATDT
jgi:DnaJ-domain-containing protein 1